MPAMDSVPEREFLDLYDRLHFPVKGVRSPQELNERIEAEVASREGEKRIAISQLRKEYLAGCIRKLRILRSSEFAFRVFEEAHADPNGYIALSLIYDRAEARRISMQRFRRRFPGLRK